MTHRKTSRPGICQVLALCLQYLHQQGNCLKHQALLIQVDYRIIATNAGSMLVAALLLIFLGGSDMPFIGLSGTGAGWSSAFEFSPFYSEAKHGLNSQQRRTILAHCLLSTVLEFAAHSAHVTTCGL